MSRAAGNSCSQALAAHAAAEVEPVELCDVVSRTIRATAVGVMQEARRGSALSYAFAERGECEVSVIAFAQGPTTTRRA